MNQHDSRSDPASQDRPPDAPHSALRLAPQPTDAGPADPADPAAEGALAAILARLRTHTGHDFRLYKRPTILRRIARRMQVRGVSSLDAYLGLLDDERDEALRLFEEVLIGVTRFFRDPDDFAALEHALVPRLFAGKGDGDDVRAWVAACSTGEEAWSLAILLHEHVARLAAPPRLQLFATDIDPRAIRSARAGAYPAAVGADVPADLLQRWFTLDADRYTLHPLLRESLLFAEHNLLSDPPFSRLDLITCRNFLIYLDRAHHRKVLETFHFALAPGGYLFLGSAESAEAAPDLFAPVDARHKLYQAIPAARSARVTPAAESATHAHQPPFQRAPTAPVAAKPAPTYGEIHRQAAMQALAPSVLVDRDAQVLHIADDAGPFLRHAGGEPTRDLVALSLPEVRLELRAALFHARQARRMAATARVRHEAFGMPRALSVTVRPLDAAVHGQDGLLLVEFHDMDALYLAPVEGADAHARAQAHAREATLLRQLDDELRATRRKLQETMDHADAAQAESHMTHEWLQSTLAQLHAVLEEQRAGQEELQSVNEELMTVNAQLRAKIEETAKAHDDLSNLIASTDIATIFLDRELRIKRTTPRVREVFNVLPADIGRPLTHLAGRLSYPQLADDARTVLQSLSPLEREVPGEEGRFYIVRVHPCRTLEDRIDGVAMTFFDITLRRTAELAPRSGEKGHRAELERQVAGRTAELERSRDLLRATMDSSTDMIQVFEAVRDAGGRIVDFRWVLNNHTSESRYGEVRGQSLLERNPGVVEEGIFQAFCAVTETGVAQQAERHYVHEQFDGWFLQSVVKLGDGVATTTKEISDWKRSQAELLRLRDEVAQARLQESQRALRASERHLELAMVAAGMYSWKIDVASGRLTFGDDANGRAGVELDDGSPDLLARLEALMPPEERAAKREAWQRAMRGEAEVHHTARFPDPASGETVWIEAHGAPIRGQGGRIERVVGVAFNVSERKRAEEALRISDARQRFLLALSDALRPLEAAGDIVHTAARVLGEHLGSDRAYYVNIDEEQQAFVVEHDWHRPGETSHAGRYPFDAWSMPWLDDGATWVVRDVDIDPVLPDRQRPSYRANGIRAAIVVPLVKGGRLVATFCTNQRLPRDWSATEVALIEDTAERIWAAVERARADAARRGSGERLALLLQSMGEGVIGVAGDGRCTFVNAAGAALLGWRSEDVAGKAVCSLLDGVDVRVAQALAAGAAVGTAARIEDALWRRADGAVAALSCVVSPMLLDGQPAGAVIVFRARA